MNIGKKYIYVDSSLTLPKFFQIFVIFFFNRFIIENFLN